MSLLRALLRSLLLILLRNCCLHCFGHCSRCLHCCNCNIHYQTLRVHTWCMAVLPHPPSCSTNPRSTIAIFFFFYYLSSRRQPTLPPLPPTSAPSCFSLSNHVRSSSGTPTHTVHLRVLPPPHLRRRGRGGPPSTLPLIIPQALPLLVVQERVVSGTIITVPFP